MTVAYAQPDNRLDVVALEEKVKAMYRDVATDPHGEFHFEMGRSLAERLGYVPAELDAIPQDAIDSFAGVGYYFDRESICSGDTVVDLGSGSGTDSFIAAGRVGPKGHVTGIDMTNEQLAKANGLRDTFGFNNVTFKKAYIEETGLESGTVDVVISNGVINLAPKKEDVFLEAARLLKPGGRLALADIVTDVQLPQGITCDATLWAACIGGALQVDDYIAAAVASGFSELQVKENPQYRFASDSAQGATDKYGVKSVSIYAIKS